MNVKGRRVNILDTPGLENKKHNKKKFSVESMITNSAMKVISKCQIVVLVQDAFECFSNKDNELLHYILKEGRGLIIMINKFDLLDKKWHIKA